MTLRIAIVAHFRHPIAPPFMGGMEAHSWHLVRALSGRGHDVTLFASGDSDGAMRVWPLAPRHYDADYPWHDFHGTDVLNRHLDRAYARAARALDTDGFDVVHNNSLHRYPPRLARQRRVPTITSLHVPPFDALRRAVHESAAPWSLFTVTSGKQMRSWWGMAPPPQARVVGNGIDPTLWPYRASGDGSCVWAGRITPTKGTHLAIAAARRAGVALTIFGAIEHADYFEAEVRPWLGREIRYGGHLAGEALGREIGRASVFLFTPLWDEPFGLAAVEAMACGLPVAAVDTGAVREVVGECGAYAAAGDGERLARAITQAMALPRAAARARVMRHFTIARMVEDYEQLYAEAMAARDVAWPAIAFPSIELRVGEIEAEPA